MSKLILLFLSILSIDIYSENISPVEVINLGVPSDSSRSHLKLSLNSSVKLNDILNNAKTYSNVGISFYFAGLGLGIVSTVLITDNEKNKAIPYLILGSAMEITAPLFSCYGGDQIHDAMNQLFPGYVNHTGWNYYKKSWLLVGLDVGVTFAGIMLANSTKKEAIGIGTGLASLGIGIAAEVCYTKSVFSSAKYYHSTKIYLN